MNTFKALLEAVVNLRGAWLFSGVDTPPVITLHFKNDLDKHKFATHVKHHADMDHMFTQTSGSRTLPPDAMEIMGVRVILYSPSDLDRGRAFEPPRG